MITRADRCENLSELYPTAGSDGTSLIDSLKSLFTKQLENPQKPFDRRAVGEIWNACLKDENALPGMEQRILDKVLASLSRQQVEHIQTKGDSQSLFKELLLYSEKLRREGLLEPSKSIQECAIKLALVPRLLELNRAKCSKDIRQIVEQCLGIIEILDKKITEISNIPKLSAQTIPASYVEALIQKIVPKKTSKQDVKNYVEELLPHLQRCLENSLFTQKENSFLALDTFPFAKEPQESESPCIWLYSDEKGTRLTFIDPSNKSRTRGDGLEETLVTDVFVPESSSENFPVANTSICMSSSEQDVLQELTNRELVLKLPLAERYFAPLPVVEKDLFCWIKKASGYQSFQTLSASLSAEDLLQICEDATRGVEILAQAGKVSLDIHPDNISFKKREDETVQAQIDHFLHLSEQGMKESSTDIRRNALAKEGYISFETDCYALVLLIAEAFFLKLEEGLSLEKEVLEGHALKSIEERVYWPHYQKVLEIKKRCGGFQGDFSKDLLQYVKKIKGEGEESFQSEVLERFALKMAVFPEISSLLLGTLQADRAHQEMRSQGLSYEQILTSSESKIPTLEDIYDVLEKARVKLQSIPREKESTLLTEISYQNVKNIVQKIRPKDRAAEVEASSIDLCQVLNNCLNESPYVGSEFRLHKNTLWKDTLTKVPFSMWVRIQKDKMILEIFPASGEPPLGVGGMKKVKPGVSVEIANDGPLVFDPIAISRLQKGFTWDTDLAIGNKIQENLLKIQGAERYFIDLSKKHAPHQIGDKVKLESISSRFNGTLYEAVQSQLLQTDEGPKILSTLDFISFLENVGLGIQLIAGEGISHGDIKVMNTALILKDGKISARLFDFDLSAKFEERLDTYTYWAWNVIRQGYGIITRETDLYGYSLMVGDTLLLGFGTCLEGSNEQIIKGLSEILEAPTASKRALRKQHVDKMDQRFPDLIQQRMISFFSNPPAKAEITDVHEDLFDQIKKLQKEGETIKATALKRFLSESLFFDLVFDLLIKTLKADQTSKTNMLENLKTLGIKAAAKKALQEAQFPTLDEIQDVLRQCRTVVEYVEAQCTKQPGRTATVFSWILGK